MKLATIAGAWMALALVASPAGAETPAPADRSALGRKIDNFTAVDVHGQPRSLADLGASELLVIAFMGTECPLARQQENSKHHSFRPFARREWYINNTSEIIEQTIEIKPPYSKSRPKP